MLVNREFKYYLVDGLSVRYDEIMLNKVVVKYLSKNYKFKNELEKAKNYEDFIQICDRHINNYSSKNYFICYLLNEKLFDKIYLSMDDPRVKNEDRLHLIRQIKHKSLLSKSEIEYMINKNSN